MVSSLSTKFFLSASNLRLPQSWKWPAGVYYGSETIYRTRLHIIYPAPPLDMTDPIFPNQLPNEPSVSNLLSLAFGRWACLLAATNYTSPRSKSFRIWANWKLFGSPSEILSLSIIDKFRDTTWIHKKACKSQVLWRNSSKSWNDSLLH